MGGGSPDVGRAGGSVQMKCRVDVSVTVYADSPYDAAKVVDELLSNDIRVKLVLIADAEEVNESPEEPQGDAFAGGFCDNN